MRVCACWLVAATMIRSRPVESLWFPKIEKSYKKRKLYKIPFTSQHRHQIVLTKPKLCISDCDGARTKHIGIHFKKEIKKIRKRGIWLYGGRICRVVTWYPLNLDPLNWLPQLSAQRRIRKLQALYLLLSRLEAQISRWATQTTRPRGVNPATHVRDFSRGPSK